MWLITIDVATKSADPLLGAFLFDLLTPYSYVYGFYQHFVIGSSKCIGYALRSHSYLPGPHFTPCRPTTMGLIIIPGHALTWERLGTNESVMNVVVKLFTHIIASPWVCPGVTMSPLLALMDILGTMRKLSNLAS